MEAGMSDEAGEVQIAFDVPARMRDGVVLRANVYRPVGRGPWPTLLTRTPYDKDSFIQASWSGFDPVQIAKQGFLVVVQDVRGRFASDGEWAPYRHEGEDGYASVDWAAALPGSNGRVGMYSASYCGNVQWLAAAEQPPALGAIAPGFTWAEPMDGLLARGGAVELGVALRWALENGYETIRRWHADPVERAPRIEALMDEWDRVDAIGYRELPVRDIAVLRRHGVPDLGAIPAIDDPAIAARARVSDLHARVEVPSLHTAGWYDIFNQGTLDNYMGAVAAGREARLIVGPWTHVTFTDPIGERLFGIRASRDGAAVHPEGSWRDAQLAWLRRHLLPAADASSGTPVRIFVMGRNEWRDEPAWPLARAVPQRWYLQSGGALAPSEPADREAASTFAYDPADPVPTVGGNGVMSVSVASGPVDQGRVERRDDVLVFTSEPLTRELEVTGRVCVVLHAESSAPSTDWVARLCDVDRDGRSFNVCDGIVRVHAGADACNRVEVDLWSTSIAFQPGHRVRLQVTSSCFPRWDRNLNTGDQCSPEHRVANQRVHHDAARPSYVELPVVNQAA
jgi:putative CocE/NonD family hydrolase